MMFFGYLGVALVVGVSAALLLVVARRAIGPVRLFLRCLRWGIATGAVTGAVVGAMIPLLSLLRNGATSWLLGLAPAGAHLSTCRGNRLADPAVALPFIAAGNAIVVLMLCRAKGSIGRLWLAAASGP